MAIASNVCDRNSGVHERRACSDINDTIFDIDLYHNIVNVCQVA